jgi:hypothetical protein
MVDLIDLNKEPILMDYSEYGNMVEIPHLKLTIALGNKVWNESIKNYDIIILVIDNISLKIVPTIIDCSLIGNNCINYIFYVANNNSDNKNNQITLVFQTSVNFRYFKMNFEI